MNCKFEGHKSPFLFLSDVLLGRALNYVVWANRSGSKSFMAGLVTWVASSFTDRLETTILGGSFEQSEKSYKAMNDFWNSTGLQEAYLKTEPTRQRTEWKNGSMASVLTASTKSVRGPHPQRVIMDEIDEMDEEVYNAALSQPQSKHGIPSSLGRLSTNHKQGGMMDQAIERSRESGTPVYKWCVWECMKACRDYSCSTCRLTSYCPGKHMKDADGYYEIGDFVQKLFDLSDQTLQVEWFCNKVGRDDLVYGSQYDENVNSPLTLPDFNPKKRVILSVDWGGTNPFSVGAWQDWTKEKIGWVRFDEVYKGNTTNQRIIADVKAKPWWKNVKEMVADPARADLIAEWRETGISVYGADNAVDAGIEATRDALSPILGKPKIYVARTCRMWRFEASAYYEKHGKPVKENDHAMDETRYFVKRYVRPTSRVRVRRI